MRKDRAMPDDRPELLTYRPWRGTLRGQSPSGPLGWLLAPVRTVETAWPVARTSLELIFRRKLFWGLYALAMLAFLLFFFGQYLGAFARAQVGTTEVRIAGNLKLPAEDLVNAFRRVLKMDGTGEEYRNYFSFQAYMVMIILALAGSVLIGNDLRFGSLAFYLSKPLSRWHYLLGKGIALAVFINLLTTLPALVLFVQFGFVEPGHSGGVWSFPYLGAIAVALVLIGWVWTGRLSRVGLGAAVTITAAELAVLMTGNYFRFNYHLAFGILGYGAILTVTLTLAILAASAWLQKTVPLVIFWTGLLFFCRLLTEELVGALHFDPRWRLLDLWNCAALLGNYCLQIEPSQIRPAPQPAWYEAAFVLGSVCILCTTYLILRIRAVEIVK
jgi:ABC-2 type transport system permease protein